MEQNPINNALVTFDMTKDILRKHVTDENQIENLYKLVNRSETAFRLAVGLIQRCNIKLNDFIEKLEERYKRANIEPSVEDNDLRIILAILSLNGIFSLVLDNETIDYRKKILLLLSYVKSEHITLDLIQEIFQIDIDIIRKALKPALEDWRMSWDEKNLFYNIDLKVQLAYWEISKQSKNEVLPYLTKLLFFYNNNFRSMFKESDLTDVKNKITPAGFTFNRIINSNLPFTDELLLNFIELSEHIGCYKMQVDKDGEQAAVYFDHALDFLKKYKPTCSSGIENSNEIFMQLSARQITALTIAGMKYLSSDNTKENKQAIKFLHDALSKAEELYQVKHLAGYYKMQVDKGYDIGVTLLIDTLKCLKECHLHSIEDNGCFNKISNSNVTALIIVGESYLSMNNNKAAAKAIKIFNEALSLAEEYYIDKPTEIAKIKFNIALAHEILGDLSKQREIYENILDSIKNILTRSDPDYVIYQYKLASVLYRLNQIDVAVQLATQVKKIFTNYNESKYAKLKISILTEMEVILSYFNSSDTKGLISSGNFFSTANISQTGIRKPKSHTNKGKYSNENTKTLAYKHQENEAQPLVSKAQKQRLCCCLM